MARKKVEIIRIDPALIEDMYATGKYKRTLVTDVVIHRTDCNGFLVTTTIQHKNQVHTKETVIPSSAMDTELKEFLDSVFPAPL